MQIDRLGRLQVRQLHVQVIRRWSIGAISISTSCQKTPLFPYSKQLLQENFLPKLMLLLKKKSYLTTTLYSFWVSVQHIVYIYQVLIHQTSGKPHFVSAHNTSHLSNCCHFSGYSSLGSVQHQLLEQLNSSRVVFGKAVVDCTLNLNLVAFAKHNLKICFCQLFSNTYLKELI